MARIAVIGGTGYAGRHIVAEAASRGHTVVSVARKTAAERVPGVTYVEGTVLDVPGLVAELAGADVVVSAVAPRGDMLGRLRPAIAELVAALPEHVRVGVTGGAGGSLVAPGGPRLIDTEGFAEEYKPEALEAIDILTDLRRRPRPATGSTCTPRAGSACGPRESARATTATAATCWSSTTTATPSSREQISPSRSSTRSRSRGNRRERFTVGY